MPLSGSLLKKPTDAGSVFQAVCGERVPIADDHESVLRGLRASLKANPDWEICGEVVDGKEAVPKSTELRPDLIVMNFAVPRLDGLRAAQEFARCRRECPLLHTVHGAAEVGLGANKHLIPKDREEDKSRRSHFSW